MFNVLFADLMVSESSELPIALAITAVVVGLLLGYFLPGARRRDEPEATGEPLYTVVVHNDDFNTFDFVIGIFGNVFTYGWSYSLWLSLKVHHTGRAIVWRGTFADAEAKAAAIRAFGPDPHGRKGVQPLVVTVEPLTA